MTPTYSFTDAAGRQWDVRINAGHLATLKAVGLEFKKELRTHLDWLGHFENDPELLVNALHVVCAPNKQGVTPEEFGEALDGPALEAAADALASAILGFFHRGKTGQALGTKWQEIKTKADDLTAKRILDLDIDRLLASPPSPAPATSSAGSSGSTPAPSPSAS